MSFRDLGRVAFNYAQPATTHVVLEVVLVIRHEATSGTHQTVFSAILASARTTINGAHALLDQVTSHLVEDLLFSGLSQSFQSDGHVSYPRKACWSLMEGAFGICIQWL
ncbi:hypothetical protein D3C80_1961040 [compost metagenome]